jgi:O-antigen/teichoic acid export membrane protein
LILNIMLPGAAGATAGGLFAISRKVSSVVQLVRTAFAYVLAPLASLASNGEKRQLAEIYGFATRVSFAVAIPLGMLLIASGPAILRFFGEEAKIAFPALAMMIAARITEASIGSAVPIQQVIGKYRLQLVGSVTGLCLALALGWTLVPQNGLTGMAISVGCGIMTAAIIPVWQLHKYRDLHPFRRPFPRSAARSAGIALAGLAIALPAYLLPVFAQLPLLLSVLLGTLWTSCRLALSREDRLALGKTGRRLRLVRGMPVPNS